MSTISKILNLKILNICEKIEEDVEEYIDKNIIKLKIKLNKKDNTIKEKLLYLLENDTNFLILNKNLYDIQKSLKNLYNESNINIEEINDIIIEYLERKLI
tara:strand:- start:51 stop:353 length:303 start_codon:yes stop_codon:yes gene_type:complete